ncbi:nucleotidyltransferase family protein [Aquariibacter albus]|uniref:Nucleotidyltransferase family protein n=1 Tax=Aquariibacter albus TaxID=2759899 RepID=A0A839HTI2_9BURK|nr:nucleotidyltransferase family protein [Aquariibacter albus]MBB1161244.1 nucleotidyltransferase family protein [Aquariibacter albus]
MSAHPAGLGAPRRPVVVVLAAGQGSRFQGLGHKLAQPLGEVGSVLQATVQAAQASGLEVLVVLRPDLRPLLAGRIAAEALLSLPAQAATAQDPPAEGEPLPGMGDSIAAGVMARPHARGWLVLPGDMPLVRPDTLAAVAAGLEQLPIAYAQHAGRRGHPVAFGAELYSELSRLRGDTGARRLIARYPAQAVEVDDPGVLIDLDTEDDLREVRSRLLTEGTRRQA